MVDGINLKSNFSIVNIYLDNSLDANTDEHLCLLHKHLV